MDTLQKIWYLLSASQKRGLIIIAGLLLIGIFFEMLGLGITIPALAVMLKPNIGNEYPSIKPFLKFIGNPDQYHLVLWGMSSLVFIYLLKTLFLMFLAWRQSIFSSGLSSELARRLFYGYLNQPYTFYLQRNSAELIRNIQSEVNLFNTVSLAFISLSTELSAILGITILLFLVEPIGTISVGLFLVIFAVIFYRLTKNKLLQWGIQRQEYEGEIARHLIEGFGGIKIAKLMGKTNYFHSLFEKYNILKSEIFAKSTSLQQFPRLYLELLAVIGLAGFVITMLFLSRPLDLLLPTLGVFVVAAFRLMPSLNRIMGSLQNLRYAKPVIDLLYTEFINIKTNIEINDKKEINFQFPLLIEAKGINFNYPNTKKKALENISFKISKGESIGFIGSSGSGKSTMVDLIIGLLKPQSGEILIDRKNINVVLNSWQNSIGYVPQFIYLTDDTIKKNIAFGLPDSDIDDNALISAIKDAQLDSFIDGLPNGVNTIVGEQGVQLSGGQRQRIGIARALYNNPQFLVFDEATSALDNKTEKGVIESIKALSKNKTILIVAHRLSTVEHCDILFKFENGKIIKEGKPLDMLH